MVRQYGAVHGAQDHLVRRFAQRTDSGWVVQGEMGLGPLAIGDEFSFVHHQDVGQEERLTLRIEQLGDTALTLLGAPQAELRGGDILGGEAIR